MVVRVFARVTTRTELKRRPKTGPLAGYPDPLQTLPVTLSTIVVSGDSRADCIMMFDFAEVADDLEQAPQL
jgi:hypothetical protein